MIKERKNKKLGRRPAIVAGVRTAFVRAGTRFAGLTAVDLGRIVVAEVMARSGIDPEEIDSVIMGNVAQPVEAVNVARVIALMAGVPESVPAYTVHRNCASGLQSIVSAVQAIETGEADLVIAGGVESMTNIPFFVPGQLKDALTTFRQAKKISERLGALLSLRPRHFVPKIGLMLGLTDPTCGLNMGQTAEVLAREFGLGRDLQDEFSLMSHQRAATARSEGRFNDEIMPVIPPPDFSEPVTFDNGVRLNQSMEALERLRPVFDRKYGSVTAGNSSQITDGAAAVIVASDEAVERLALEPMGFVRDWSFAGLSPKRMGLGPAYATSLVLEQTGVELADIGLIEMNEAFAAQVISNEAVFGMDSLSERYLGRKAMGRIDRSLMNVNGGAIAMGHPVGASGTRLAVTLLLEMKRRGVDRGLATLCVGGGQGAALLLERT